MDIEDFKRQVKDIADLAATVPEPFQEKCFELLLNHLIRQAEAAEAGHGPKRDLTPPAEEAEGRTDLPGRLLTTAAVRVLMRKANVTEADLGKILMIEDKQLYFLKEPKTKKAAQGQREWSLLMALKNAFLKNNLAADAEEVRSICQEKGYYDKANFAKTLKGPKMAGLFKSPLEPQGDAQTLANDGLDALGALVKTLADESA